MSDPVTNVEIEDVLSSIRKLVAEDARTAPAAPSKPSVGRLVLTPALRVKDAPAENDDAPDTEAEPMVLADPLPQAAPKVDQERPIDDIPGDARLADFGEVEGAFPDVDIFDTPEPKHDDEPDEPLAGPSTARLDLSRLIEAEVAAALGGTADSDETVGHNKDAWAQDGLEDDEMSNEDITFEHRSLEEHAFIEPVVEAEEHPVDTPAAPLTLEDKVAALSRLVVGGAQDFEEERDAPDADELTAVSEPMAWPNDTTYDMSSVEATEHGTETLADVEDEADSMPEAAMAIDVEPEVDEASNVLHAGSAWPAQTQSAQQDYDGSVAEPQGSPVSDRGLPAATTNAPQSLAIDEEMLREVVSDIVRQELQGVLGERITRNVRKLVRREIHRMLVSQELE